MKMTLVNTPDFAMLPVEERKSVLDWQEAMEAVDRADSKFAECRRQATLHPGVKGWKSPRAIQKKFYAWINAGKSWTVLVNWAKVPRMAGPRDDALGNAYKAYAERNQRSGRQGHAALLRDLRSGKHIEGVGTWEDVWRAKYPRSPLPMRCPADWIPPGWHYENLQRKYPLSSYERANATRGAVAARQFAPPVYSTRVGMPVGAEYQFDDMWDDLVVSVPGVNSKLVRPLQFRCIDRASTHLVSWGVKPQILRDDQSREGLGKALFKATVADVLCNQGFRPKDAGGTVFVIEHGTASLSEEECALVTRLTDGAVTFRRSDVLGKQVNDGVFPGQGHGNFRAKALLESLHRLPHFAAAALPGQVGSVSQHGMGVESLYGLEKYANRLLAAYERIPAAIRNQVSYGGALPFACYRVLMAELYELIDTRRTGGLPRPSPRSIRRRAPPPRRCCARRATTRASGSRRARSGKRARARSSGCRTARWWTSSARTATARCASVDATSSSSRTATSSARRRPCATSPCWSSRTGRACGCAKGPNTASTRSRTTPRSPWWWIPSAATCWAWWASGRASSR